MIFIAYYFCQLQNLKEEFSNGVIYFVRKEKAEARSCLSINLIFFTYPYLHPTSIWFTDHIYQVSMKIKIKKKISPPTTIFKKKSDESLAINLLWP